MCSTSLGVFHTGCRPFGATCSWQHALVLGPSLAGRSGPLACPGQPRRRPGRARCRASAPCRPRGAPWAAPGLSAPRRLAAPLRSYSLAVLDLSSSRAWAANKMSMQTFCVTFLLKVFFVNFTNQTCKTTSKSKAKPCQILSLAKFWLSFREFWRTVSSRFTFAKIGQYSAERL